VELLIVQSGRWRLMSSGGKAEDKDGARERRQARRGLAGARAVHSGQAQVLYDAQFAGRAAIEISGPGPIPAIFRESYYVAPRTHQPLGLVQRGAGKAGETWTTRFITYRLLPGTVANRALVTVPGTHPDATIDTRPAITPRPPAGYPVRPQRHRCEMSLWPVCISSLRCRKTNSEESS
jgi:hypothetical protein